MIRSSYERLKEALIVALVGAAISMWLDVRDMKAQMLFFHGPWPPVHNGEVK